MSNAAYQPGQSHVYAIAGVGTGRIKLGRATDPADRLRQLQVGSPVPLRLLCSAPEVQGRTERDLHSQRPANSTKRLGRRRGKGGGGVQGAMRRLKTSVETGAKV